MLSVSWRAPRSNRLCTLTAHPDLQFPSEPSLDHRINLTLYDLSNIINGKMDAVIDALREEDKRKRFGELYS